MSLAAEDFKGVRATLQEGFAQFEHVMRPNELWKTQWNSHITAMTL